MYFMYNLHTKNTILYVTLYVRKVTIEEQKLLETTWVTHSYKATVVLRWYVFGPKLMVFSIVILNEVKHKMFQVCRFHCETSMGLSIFSLCYFNFSNCCSSLSTCFSQRLSLLTNAMLGSGPYTTTLLVLVFDREKKPLKLYGTP